MKKRKIQIIVISSLIALTFGGAFLNHKFAQEATSKTSDTQVATSKTDDTEEVKKEKADSEKKAEKNEKSAKDSSKKSTKENDAEKKIADKSSGESGSSATEPNNDTQEQSKNPEANGSTEQTPAVERQETPAAPPATPSQPNTENKPAPEVKKEVTLSIRGTAANSSAYFISPQKVVVKDGQTVMDVLSDYCRDNGIQVGIRGGTYVAGINNLYEFDKGAQSGWLYRVNGVFPNYGAAQYTLQVGDTIEWMYTEDMGKDVGAPQV